MRAFFLLAGIIFWVMAALCYYFGFQVLWWEVRPFTIFTVPFAGIGALIFCYGLVAGRKIGGTSSQKRKIGGGKTK